MRKRLIAIILGVVLAALGLGINAAYAGSGNQWCDNFGTCLNSWAGTYPDQLKTYGYSTQNNDFTTIPVTSLCNGGITTSTCPGPPMTAGHAIVRLQVSGGSNDPNNGMCVQDYENDQYDAAGGTNSPCSGTVGWGANFVDLVQGSGSCQGYVTFYNIHWKGLVTFTGESNGEVVYLNGASGVCFQALPPR